MEMFFKSFLHLSLMILPLFTLGVLCGAFIETKLSSKWVLQKLSSSKISLLKVSIFAALIPGCACATMPLAKALKHRGLNTASLMSFLMMSPLLGPHTIFLTFALLGTTFGFYRLLFSFIGSVVLGCFLLPFENKFKLPLTQKTHDSACCTQTDETKPPFFQRFIKQSRQSFLSLSPYLAIGIVLAVCLPILLHEELIQFIHKNQNKPWLYAVMALISIPMYVCEAEEIPITLGLLEAGLPEGLAFSFMLAAVGTCIPTALMALKIIGWKLTAVYLSYWFIFSILTGIFVNGFQIKI